MQSTRFRTWVTVCLLLFLAPGRNELIAAEPLDYTQTLPEELGVHAFAVKRDPKTGFIYGGKNSTALIRSLTEMNGRTIADLEADMRPDANSDVGSTAGFLGAQERLLEVLAEDNRYVVEECRLTHQELAQALNVLAAIGLRLQRAGTSETEFRYRQRRFKVQLFQGRGFQDSPFRDGTKTNTDVTIWNLDSGKKLSYSLLVPQMIERYGFYEGKGTSYRVDPHQVVEVLDFLTSMTAEGREGMPLDDTRQP